MPGWLLRSSLHSSRKYLLTAGDYVLNHCDRHGSPAVKNTDPKGDGAAPTNTTMALLGI